MEEINKRLVEVDYILKKLDNKYINKIPQEVWDYITENKDKNYVFKYDDDKTLAEQKKRKKYNPDDLFKNKKAEQKEQVSLVEVKIEKWYEKLFSFLKNMFRK